MIDRKINKKLDRETVRIQNILAPPETLLVKSIGDRVKTSERALLDFL